MRQLLMKGIYSDHYTETAIEPIKVFGSKRIHGVQVVKRKLVEKNGYIFDYGAESITCKRLFDRPLRADSEICRKEFEFAAQEIKKGIGIA